MARLLDTFKPHRCTPVTAHQMKAFVHVRSLFGAAPTSIRNLSQKTGSDEVCVVKVGGILGPGFELIYADGLLVGIPPKKLKRK